MKIKYFLAVVFLLSYQSFAQNDSSSLFWGQLGSGMNIVKYSQFGSGGMNFSSSINYETSGNYLAFCYLVEQEFVLFTSPAERIKTYSIMYGRTYNFEFDRLLCLFPIGLLFKVKSQNAITGKVGISYFDYLERKELLSSDGWDHQYASHRITGYGIPIELEWRNSISTYFGFTISAYAFIDKLKNHYGFNYGIYFGKVTNW